MKTKFLLSLIFVFIACSSSLFSQELKYIEDANSYTYMKGDTLIQEYFTNCGGVGYKLEIEGGTLPYTKSWYTEDGATEVNEDSIHAIPSPYSLAVSTVQDGVGDEIFKWIYFYNKIIVQGLPDSVMIGDTSYWTIRRPILTTMSGPGIYLDAVENQYYFRPDSAGVGEHVINFSYPGPIISDPDSICLPSPADPFTITVVPELKVTSDDLNTCLFYYSAIFSSASGGFPPYTYEWKDMSGTVVSNNNFVSNTSSSPGIYTFTCNVTDSRGNKASSVSTVWIDEPSAPPLVSDISYCIGTTASPLTATGTNLLWYTDAIGGTPSSIAPIPSTAVVGSTIYYVSQDNGCVSPRAAIEVVVKAKPIVSITPSATEVCSDGTISLILVPTTGGILTGPGSSGLTFNPADANVGSNTIQYSYTDANACTNTDTQIITVYPNSLPITTQSISLQIGDPSPTLTATGIGTIQWYNSSNVLQAANTNYAPGINTSSVGIYTYYVSNKTGMCESPKVSVTVTVSSCATFAPTVTTPVNYCQSAAASPLTASGTNLLWYTEEFIGIPSSTAPMPSTATVGSTFYYVSQTTTCEGPRAAIEVIVKAKPLAPIVTTPVNHCQPAPSAPLTATGDAGSILRWYNAATGGFEITGAIFPPTVIGTTFYYVSQTINGCESPRAAIEVIVKAIPPTPAINTNSPICEGEPITLQAYSSGVSTYSWTGPSGFTATVQNPTIASATFAMSGTYTVTASLNGCSSTAGSVVVVNPNPIPTITANLGLDQANGNPIVLGVTNVGNAIVSYTWSGSASAYLAGATTISTPTFSGYPLGEYDVSVEVFDINGCSNTTNATLTNNVQLSPTITGTGTTPILCLGMDLLLGVTGGPYTTYDWSTSGSGISFTSTTISTPIITAISVGTFDITVEVTDGNGNTGTHTVSIQVGGMQPSTIIPTVPNSIYITTSPFDLNPSPFHSFSGTGIIQPSTFNPNLAGIGSHIITIYVNQPGSCEDIKTSFFTINVIPECSISADFDVTFHDNLDNMYEFDAQAVNDVTYYWDLPDGSQYIGIDKQTITHKFHEDITGDVCLTVIDNMFVPGCGDTVCINTSFEKADTLLSISGKVKHGETLITCGKTIAFMYQNNAYVPVDTVDIDVEGNYMHTLLFKGAYIILAKACNEQLYLPTYFYSSLTQANAQSLYLEDDATSVDINVREVSTAISTLENSIEIYPNPMVSNAIVKLGNIDATEIQIVSVMGVIVLTIPVNSDSVIINRQALIAGQYIIIVKDKSGIVAQQTLIVK